jgi:hypothetical protein
MVKKGKDAWKQSLLRYFIFKWEIYYVTMIVLPAITTLPEIRQGLAIKVVILNQEKKLSDFYVKHVI